MLYCDSLVWFLILDLCVLLRSTHLHSSLANFLDILNTTLGD